MKRPGKKITKSSKLQEQRVTPRKTNKDKNQNCSPKKYRLKKLENKTQLKNTSK